MRNLAWRVSSIFFLTTAAVTLGLLLVIHYRITEQFDVYLQMSGMHGAMMGGRGHMMAAMVGGAEGHFLLSLRQSLLAAAGVMLVIGGAISYYLGRSIARPVVQLNQAVKQVQAGDYNAAVNLERYDEVGQLAEAFNDMIEKLQADLILRQRFLAGIAHELRTPLTILKANLEGISDGIIVPDKEQLASLVEEVDRLSTMVNDLRELSLLEAGQLTPSYSEVDVPVLLQRIIMIIRPLAAAKELAVSMELPPLLPSIEADAKMLQQMLYNLLLNAIRYTTAGHIRIYVQLANEYIEFSVEDTGVGIAEEELAYIFDYFYRVDPARAKQSGGTGLGLALVRQMARAHGGEVEVKSRLGQGSTFILRIPCHKQKKRIHSS